MTAHAPRLVDSVTDQTFTARVLQAERPVLETKGTAGLRAGLMDALREAVRTGKLPPGTRLPSSRSLAADLGIARNTVADAYAELVAEGWLTARQGSGTRVAQRAEPPRAESTRATGGAAGRAPLPTVRPRPAHNLMPGSPDLSTFPRAEWLKASRRALTAAPNDSFGYGDPRGRVELRTELARLSGPRPRRVRGPGTDRDIRGLRARPETDGGGVAQAAGARGGRRVVRTGRAPAAAHGSGAAHPAPPDGRIRGQDR